MVKITAETSLYGVFGKPVFHSMGPLIHNTLFNQMDIDAVYLAFQIEDITKAVEAIRTLGIKAVSVTIPFKEAILAHLDEIDEMALEIGAVNTVINKDGHLFGCNTDCDGAVQPLKAVAEIRDRNVLIFGAGGAARAVAFGIAKEGGFITVVNRDKTKGKLLAQQVGGEYVSFDAFRDSKSSFASFGKTDIVINCTSLGMTPHVNETPVNSDLFSLWMNKNMVVMDIVYNPLNTKLLQDARGNGCTTVDGLSMFIHQGAAQFQLFTGRSPSLGLMREITEQFLKR